MRSVKCRAVREEVQTAHDQERPPGSIVKQHVVECRECREFASFITTLGEKLSNTLESDRALTPALDPLTVIRVASVRRRHRFLARTLSGLAAALILGVGGMIGGNLVRESSIKQAVSEETQYFVDDLFSQPLFDGIEYLSARE